MYKPGARGTLIMNCCTEDYYTILKGQIYPGACAISSLSLHELTLFNTESNFVKFPFTYDYTVSRLFPFFLLYIIHCVCSNCLVHLDHIVFRYLKSPAIRICNL